MQSKKSVVGQFLFFLLMVFIICCNNAVAQNNYVVARVAKIRVDPAKLPGYMAALKEEIQTAVREEPGVLTLYAVADKKFPSRITIFEVYADEKAYKAHLETPHFKQYKLGTKSMVKSLVLTECTPIALGAKSQDK
jgi:quinol monooxygenase YgiN